MLQLRKNGYSYPRIAVLMEIPSEDIVRRRYEKLVPAEDRQPVVALITDEEKAEFTRLYESGLTMTAIAEKMGKTKGSVCGLRYRLGLKPRTRIALAGRPNPYGCQISKTRLKARCDGKPRAPKINKDPSDLIAAERRIAEAADVGFHNGGLTFEQLTPSCCRFIKGDVKDPEHRYCGSKTVPGRSWCRHHYFVVYRP
jgi:hypothetical protein